MRNTPENVVGGVAEVSVSLVNGASDSGLRSPEEKTRARTLRKAPVTVNPWSLTILTSIDGLATASGHWES